MYKLVRDLTTNNNCLFVLDTMTDRYTWFRPNDIKLPILKDRIAGGSLLLHKYKTNDELIGYIADMYILDDGDFQYVGDFETFAELTNFIVKFRTLLELEK